MQQHDVAVVISGSGDGLIQAVEGDVAPCLPLHFTTFEWLKSRGA